MSGAEWTIVDTETTGIIAPIYTLEIAAQRMSGLRPVGQPFRVLLNHKVDIPAEAQAVHGYSRLFLEENGTNPAQAHKLFADYVGDSPISSYNLPYDYDKVLVPEWNRLEINEKFHRGFCLLRLAKKLINPSPAGNYKLQSLRSHFGLPDRVAHSALGDVFTVIDLIEVVLAPYLENLGLKDMNSISEYLERHKVLRSTVVRGT
jgi:DNA polymerase III epsilon subunit-like protein